MLTQKLALLTIRNVSGIIKYMGISMLSGYFCDVNMVKIVFHP